MSATTVPDELKTQMAVAIKEYMKEHGESPVKNQAKTSVWDRVIFPTIVTLFIAFGVGAIFYRFTSLEDNDRELRTSLEDNDRELRTSLEDNNRELRESITKVNSRIDDLSREMSARVDKGNDRIIELLQQQIKK